MAKKIAPVSLTGGAGYDFEDEVAAWFLLHLLCGDAPLEAQFGIPVAVEFQARESGWLLDDLLITCEDGLGLERRIAVSVKRDRQVTQAGFPPGFVTAAWQHWLGQDLAKNPFRRGLDLLCLATGLLADSVYSAWDEMLQQALLTAPARVAGRLATSGSSNAIQRALFASLQCPESLAQAMGTDASSAAELLTHMRLMRFDFRSPTSRDRQDAIGKCRRCLRQGSLAAAADLWDDLVAIAKDLRGRGGSINLEQLLRRLTRYDLGDYPDYRADWDTLRVLSFEAMASIRARVGPDITVPRNSLVTEIYGQLESMGLVVLLGESGAGKSALAKSIAIGGVYQRAVWLNGQHLESQGLSTASRSLGLVHSLTQILPAVGAHKALLVLDSLESCSPYALRNAAELIGALNPGTAGSRWHVLMTSQPFRWESVQLRLQTYDLTLPRRSVFPLEAPDIGTLVSATRTLPSLSALLLQPQLGELLRNLKTLDWVAGAICGRTGIGEEWAGLSDVVDSVWSWWIQSDDQRYVRDSVLKAVALEESESFSGVVSLDRLTRLDRQVLGELERQRLLDVRQGRVSFTHGLLGDWARLQTLTGIPEARIAHELRKRAENPRWQAAVRLYGLRTLERALDGSAWLQLIRQLDDSSNPGRLAADIALEAAALAPNARRSLGLVWPHLAADEGRLLRRLLRRFRHSATYPQRAAVALTRDQDVGVWLASSMRIPTWPFWGPMLELLHAHANEVKDLAPASAGALCHLWLSTMPTATPDGRYFPWRRQAADISLTLARELQGLLAEHVMARRQVSESVYQALLSAAPDLPDEVCSLALQFAKRRPLPSEILKGVEERERQRIEEHEERIRKDAEYRRAFYEGMTPSFLGPLREPWPAGPTERVDEPFREVCLEKQALHALMATCPDTAKEVILALCIEPPLPEEYAGEFMLGMGYGTTGEAARAMFFEGPFLAFLRINAEKAIELIIELVDFATERWRDRASAKGGTSVDLETGEDQWVDIWVKDGKRKLIGDGHVLGWYRENLIHAPYVVSALMALEKWLYDQTDASVDVSEWVELILQRTRSLAFVGVLIALGKKHPELLARCLRPILSIWQVYQWDWAVAQADAQGISGVSLWLWVGLGEETFNVVRDWHLMPHRRIYFRDLVIQRFLGDPGLQQWFGEIRGEWRRISERTTAGRGSLEFLVERFDPANYRLEEDEHGQLTAMLELPDRLRDESEASMRASSYSFFVLDFPRKCRSLLDSGRQLDCDALAHFWQSLQYLVEEYDEERVAIGYFDNAVMAGIAVLAILHEEWLEADDERADWCAKQIERIVGSDRCREAGDLPGSVYELRWQVFLGEIAVHWLGKDPADRQARALAAQSILAYHYDTTGVLCKAAFRLRGTLGDEFGRLLNLCRLWAGIRHAMDWCRHHRLDTSKVQNWYEAAVASFVEEDLQAAPIPLKEIASRSEKLIFEAIREHELKTCGEEPVNALPTRYLTNGEVPDRAHLGLDWQVIQASYAWLPPLGEASNASEREAWIAIHEELLQLELIYLQTARRNRWGEVDCTPYEFEYWILDLVAGLIPQLPTGEQPERFWRPILDLGGNAHYWVESFFSKWFVEGSKAASEPEVFARHWRAMIQYAMDSESWRTKGTTGGHLRLEDLYLEVMGLGLGGGAIVEQEEYADVLTSLLPLYREWAGEWLGRAGPMKAFASFVVKPAARGLMLPGLAWLAEAMPRIPEREWDESRLADRLLMLLVTCWRRHLPELESDSEIKKAFVELLNALVAREHPGAFELRDVILR